MIQRLGNLFVLDTKSTTYAFSVLSSGHLEHLYYGKKIHLSSENDLAVLSEKRVCLPGNAVLYSKDDQALGLEDVCLEMSSCGKGDIRQPFVEIVHADGSSTSDFLFVDALIQQGKTPLETLPSSYEENGDVQELIILLKDHHTQIELQLHYAVFEKQNVITRSAKVINASEETIVLNRLMSTQLDLSDANWMMTSFHGAWAREMKKHSVMAGGCRLVNESVCGTSSSRANPFVMLSRKSTTEDEGECYGLNLVYSGNHMESVETGAFGKLRFISGIHPDTFQFQLEKGESFEAPEAVMTYSHLGFNGMSQNMHRFVRECIVRGKWKNKLRPVLLNSWEACYFDINERKLLNLAKAGKEVGIELFVMDDGWFGTRDDDTQALGDWKANPKKLPQGITGLSKKINDLGLDFGLWVEPEIVNVNSDLYRSHPDWVIQIPGKPHSESRNQRILDFCNPVVVDYMTRQMEDVFSSGKIAYVKWDMNRIFSDVYSPFLPSERQKEVSHRYMMGIYQMMNRLMKKFPDILFEGCASGGNRFDLGMLCYFPQIWASDDSDAIYRVEAQTNYSYGYPMSTVSAHVSGCPNHQTLRNTPLSTRFHVAAFGVLGYECHLGEMSKEELKEIKAQIELYKTWREVLQKGSFYRGRNGDNIYEWTCVSPDQSKACGMVLQKLVQPNTSFEMYTPKGLLSEARYHFSNRQLQFDLKEFGSLVNQVSPIHIKQNSLIHNVASSLIKMKGEVEDFDASGELLMNAGVKLKQGFAATGYADDIRFFSDFGSRMYFMEELNKDS
ncbi:MAG: alpha-galactosidase [Erysipelotrichaceae bacterium]|nr:alpha-galactosidase [Erysipelotrichaceae bacterium]